MVLLQDFLRITAFIRRYHAVILSKSLTALQPKAFDGIRAYRFWLVLLYPE